MNINSNHPPQTLKQFPKTISKILTENLSSKEVFGKSKIYHQGNGNKN